MTRMIWSENFDCVTVMRNHFLLLVTVLWLTTDAAFADKAGDDFNLGVGLYRSQRYDQSAETFGQFLKDFPEHPRANIARLYGALSLNSLEQYAPARELFTAFLKVEPDGKNAADARYRLGECSYYLRDYPAAIEQLSTYLDKHSGHALGDWAKLFLGDSYVATEQWQKAEATLSALVQNHTTAAILADARLSLGRAFEGMKRTPEALEQFKAVAGEQESPLAPRALNRIGAIHFAAEQYKEAAATYEQLIANHATSSLVPSASLAAGMSWYRTNEFEKALPRFRAVPTESPSAAQAILMTAMSLKELGRTDESRQVFAEALKAAGDSPLATDILFQHAQMERAVDAKPLAAQLYEDIADRWPASNRTAECLFNASELHLELNNAEKAERLWSRMKKEFPAVAAQPREQILLGRLLLSRGDVDKATETLQRAAGESADSEDRVVAVGRYYLVRALYKGKKHDQVVQQASLMTNVLKDDARGEMQGALALAAVSSLELKQFDNVLKFADGFLPHARDAKQKADVAAARAVALSHLRRLSEATESLRQLVASHPDEPQTWTAVLQAADAAMEQNAADDAARIFAIAAGNSKDAAVREAGFAGVAWSQFKGQNFADAEKSFTTLIQDFPDSEDLAQSVFMQARSIEEQGNAERTATAYASVFERLTKNQPPAVTGAESTPPLQFAFDAGRQTARMLEKLQRVDDADKAWEALATRFPDATEADKVLDEWAWLNVSAKRFNRSDEIHRRLVERFPDSPFAGQARLSLAESQMDAGQLDASLKEMAAIVADARYAAAEKERALFHVIEIQAAGRNWQSALMATEQFLADYAPSPLTPQVRQFAGDALLQLSDAGKAATVLEPLRQEIIAGTVPVDDWTDRVWVLLAETALAQKQYDQIDVLEADLKQRSGQSRFTFQMNDIQGRRWKQQAPPDFAKARQYFGLVTADIEAEGTETAARCQFLIAESWMMQAELDEAVKEYFKVYLSYSYDELRAQALFQAAACEAQLQRNAAAIRDFRDLVATFPQSEFAARAQEELKKLGAAGQ